jgi:diguanylate cyclase (GGDEF)-like protein
MIKPEKPLDESDRLKALNDLDILDTPLNPSFERITRLAKKMLDVPMVAISLVDADRQWFKSEQGLNTCETNRDISFCGHAILQDEVFIIPDALLDKRFFDNPLVIDGPHIRFYAGNPIRNHDGYKIGSFCVMDTKPREISAEELESLKDMTALVEQQLFAKQQKDYQSKIMKELDHANREKLIDALTRVWNRAGLEVNFVEHTTKAKNNKLQLALTMIDIDNFKHINDTYGHNAGDQVLRDVTKRILLCLDEQDVLGRWGGEEFLGIIAIKCETPEMCVSVFEKARLSIANEPFEYDGHKIDVTASFGITVSKDFEEDMTNVVAKADHALYEAKNTGKNKSVLEY